MSSHTQISKDTTTLTFTFENTRTQPHIINNVIVHEKERNGDAEANLTPHSTVDAGKSILVTIPLTTGKKEGIFYPFIYMDSDMDTQTSRYYTYHKYPINVIVDVNTLEATLNTYTEINISDETAVRNYIKWKTVSNGVYNMYNNNTTDPPNYAEINPLTLTMETPFGTYRHRTRQVTNRGT